MPPRLALVDSIFNQTSPFYVHPWTSFMYVTLVFINFNYHFWARSMCRALGGYMKIDFIDGTIVISTDPFDHNLHVYNSFYKSY